MGSIAVAGISGYTGRRLLPHLSPEARLVMRPSTAVKEPWCDDPRAIGVDLLDEKALEPVLRGVETVVSLVGTTRAQFRNASETEPAVNYDTVDVGIPRALAHAGRRAGARRFVLLSSYGIDAPGAYPAAKRMAEEAVRVSGLSTVILRPSFIVGPNRFGPKLLDALWAPIGLFARKFAGDIRAIDVDVLARAIARIASTPRWDGQVLGGNELQRIGRADAPA